MNETKVQASINRIVAGINYQRIRRKHHNDNRPA